ncbi:Nn.00g099930.m01.CDS01 [Neocucurbitaria sp. VM-36]
MGSDWRRSVHPHLQSAGTTLPSVAELLSSSRAIDSAPTYYRIDDSVRPPPVERPDSRSTPPTAPPLGASANASTTAEPLWTAVNHASPRVSPTDIRDPASALEPPQYHLRELQPAGPAFVPTSTSQASQSVQDAVLSQSPINSQRQDSAISHQQIEAFKDTQSTAASSDFTFSYSRRSPNNSQQSTSPRPNSHPTTPSPPLLAADRRSSQVSSLPLAAPLAAPPGKGRSNSSTSSNYISMEHAKPNDQVADLSSPANIDPSTKSSGPSHQEQPSTTTTRQQRYNVRFIANYTSENMPPSQKPRHDPSPVVPAATESSEPEPEPAVQEQPVTQSIEPSIPTAAPSNQAREDQSQSQQRRREPSVERCPGCNEPWKRPLPNTDSYRQSSPAENSNDLGRMSMNLIAKLQAHQKKADAMYDRWKWKHSHCVPQDDYDNSPPSPAFTEPQEDSHSTDGDGTLRDNQHPQTPSNKRKSEAPHDGDQKSRKVTFDTQSTAAPPIRPSASA